MNSAETRLQLAMLRSIRWYQSLWPNKPSPCRFFPSCSEYAHEAIEIYGSRRGGWLMIKRLLRCRPFGPSGFDPVPLNIPESSVNSAVSPPTVSTGQNGHHESC
jgi:hypothetical protein